MRNERGGGGVCLELVEKVNVWTHGRSTEHGARSTDGGQGIPKEIKNLLIIINLEEKKSKMMNRRCIIAYENKSTILSSN
jgi:hypothetical protein